MARRVRHAALLAVILFAAAVVAPRLAGAGTGTAGLAPCGNPGPAPVPVQHVVVVMMENLSYNQVVGSPNAPYQTSLAADCGVGTSYFGATHTSAANYLAMSAGEYPAASTKGCGSVRACADPSNNLYNQLSSAGLTWAGFMEGMPANCDPASGNPDAAGQDLYKIGHNPILYYTDIPASTCQADDIADSDLTAQSGPFWEDLENQTLPSFSWVTPDEVDDGEGPGGTAQQTQAGDTWLQGFLTTVEASPSYQAGNTLVLITYDEGSGPDQKTGEDCTNESLDLPVVDGVSAHQDSCHVPLFVVYPYTPAGDADPTFFDHYSVTRTVEDLFGLPYLAHAGDAQTASLVGHFGIAPPPADPAPEVAIDQPADDASVSGPTAFSGTAQAQGGASISQVQLSVDGGPPQTATGTTSWSASLDTTALANGPHVVTVTATDSNGLSSSAAVTVDVANPGTGTACPAVPIGSTELSGNVSVETGQTGWTGKWNSSSVVTRVEPAGGSYDGLWALQVGLKAGSTTTTAGVLNAGPVWVTSTTAGGSYTGSVFVQPGTVGETLSPTLEEKSSSGAVVGSRTTTVTAGATGWQQLTTSYTAKDSGDDLVLGVHGSGLTSGGAFLADCLSLQAP